MSFEDMPLFSMSYGPDTFKPDAGSVFIYGQSVEDRSLHVESFIGNSPSVRFIKIDNQTGTSFHFVEGDNSATVSLRNAMNMDAFLRQLADRRVYIDITGLIHPVWAPLIKYSLKCLKMCSAVYVEPDVYKQSITPTEGQIFDLSERIKGISPIPGFISLREANEDDVTFIPLLGFEGTRLSYLIEQVQPPGGKTYPIIGVPGFRPEYPFHTFLGNKLPLLEKKSWKNVRLATANCPFSAFYALKEISALHPSDLFKIAPIGTKPHALGAILFASTTRLAVELVYDHPIRRVERTQGAVKVLVYNLTPFIDGN